MLVRYLAVMVAFMVPIAQAQNTEIAATVTDERGRPVADAVVIAVPADGNLRLPARAHEDVVDQVDKEFLPKVQAVLVGTAITFPNRDSVRHQVYSFSLAKRFELPLYAGVPQAVVFDKPGVVILGCNIHDWMVGYVYVSESPYFAKTNAEGKAVLTDMPARSYVVRVWHPQLVVAEDTTGKKVDALRGQRAEVAWSVSLKPEIKIRRATTNGQRAGY